ncbi:MAG: DUF2235 domain-containing protein [Sphingobacteriaceae bacterium]|nr:MAG: DUF2235 domain-containing protein [Sphingobacteriaceae bacterium]
MKRIITCSDGTWNNPNQVYKGKPVSTNVQRIFEAICNSDEQQIQQIKYYDEGIGAEGSWLNRWIDGATGKGIDDNILNAYKFILWNYEPGDQLYLFGFSRGAYTARSLAGLIRNCGILKNDNLSLIKEAYRIYRARNPVTDPNGEVALAFKQKHSYYQNLRIKFIGVWDTVGSLGIPSRWFQWYNKKKYQFHDTTLSSITEYAYHALAIDEKRSNFMPALWEISNKVRSGEVNQLMEQVWFPGVHANIGGGYPDQGLSDITLSWMIAKATLSGLAFEKTYIETAIKPNVAGQLYDSKKFPFSLLPDYIRPVCKDALANETVNPAAYKRMEVVPGYHPKNLEEIKFDQSVSV